MNSGGTPTAVPAGRSSAATRDSAGRDSCADRNHCRDRGSVTPLILGMTVILLIFGAGITAAGSAFLAGQRVQSLCDGAAAAAGNAIAPDAPGRQRNDAAVAAANGYLAIRDSGVRAVVTVDDGRAVLRCAAEAPVSFGWVFATPTVHREATAVGRPAFTG